MEQLGKRVGSGACSEVFEWEQDKVVKVFRTNQSRHAVHVEFQNSVAVWEAGLPVPKPYEVVEEAGRLGIVFEKIEGVTILDRIVDRLLNDRKPAPHDEAVSDIRIIAQTLYDIHRHSVPTNLRNQIDLIKGPIERTSRLTVEEKTRIWDHVQQLPIRHAICHGDPNPFNIMIRDGKPVMIDWSMCCIGDPAADVAEFILVCRFGELPKDTPVHVADQINPARSEMVQVFVEAYKGISGMRDEEIEAWIVPLAVCKLAIDGLSEEQYADLTQFIKHRMSLWDAGTIAGVEK